MKTDNAVIRFIEDFPTSASLKEADTGRYIVNNASNSKQFGVDNPKDICGLTIKELNFRHAEWGGMYAKSIEKLDHFVRDKKSHITVKSAFLDHCGEAQMEEMTKFPLMGASGNILAIATYRHDLTATLSPISIYKLNKNFYDSINAIKRTLNSLSIDQYFISPPTEAQLHILLLKCERLTSKEISRSLGISSRTVESHCLALRGKIVNGDMSNVLSFLKNDKYANAI